MKYCYNCNRVTAGEPLFCNFCGRSYDVKLCPRLHVNPRNAQACSQCGSRDFSTPQPRAPLWAPIVQFLLSLVPGLILAVLSAAAIGFFVTELVRQPDMLFAAIVLLIALGFLWWVWSQLPTWFRTAIHNLLKRRRWNRDRNERR
jgi:RNA polymerase subunit RPABC4/transcription elongation factor Spt4